MEFVIAQLRFLICAVVVTLLCAGCSSNSKVAEAETAEEDVVSEGAVNQDVLLESEDVLTASTPQDEAEDWDDPCDQTDTAGWLDGTQEWVYEATCRSAAWFDGFFGTGRGDPRTGETHGRVGLSGFWDQRDGFDPKLRFRGKFALPGLHDRADFTVGRGDAEEIIEERTTRFDTIPGNFNNIDDDSFLVGLGFSSKKRTGFKVSVGAKIRAPPEPYIKLRYRKHWAVSESTMIGLRPIVYWKSDDKFGTTLNTDISQMLTDHIMLRWSNYGNIAQDEDIEGLEWESSLYLFHALSNRKALTYRLMILGKTKAEVPLANYGFEFRFRRRVYRDWLFLELISSATWPREFIDESRDLNIGIGAGLEMHFGPVPDHKMY